MRAIACGVLCLLLQETHELKWTLKEGQAFTCAWAMESRITSPDAPGVLMDCRFEVRGSLKVGKVDGGEARCELTLSRYSLKGKVGADDTDILYEDGAMKRPSPDTAGGRKLQQECSKPMIVKLTPRGAYTVEGKHIVAALFGGQSDFFGSQLPPIKVAVGSSWDGTMESPQARQAGKPPMKVRYKLESVKGDEARIVLDERQNVEAANKVMDFHAVTESTFNVRAGHCSKAKATVHVNDMTDPKRKAPATPDMVVVTEFEMAEKK
jgi:hypothetical protein